MPTTSNFGWTTPADTDLVKDGAAAIRTLGNGIDTSLVDLKGGTTGQVLSKASNTDLDFTWTNGGDITEVTAGTGLSGGGTSGAVTLTNTVATTFDAKGDLVVGTGADTFSKLTVGANNTVLTADSSTATGLKWAAISAGKILQVVQTIYSTETTISTTAATDTGLSASITPSSTSSRILVMINQTIMVNNFPTAIEELKSGLALLRGSTNIYNQQTTYGVLDFRLSTTIGRDFGTKVTLLYVDSPNTTSSTTYKTQALLRNSNQTLYAQTGGTNSSIILMEIGA